MASCTKWILNIHSFTIWIKNEQLPVDHTFWWPILRKKFHEIFTLVWEAISKTRAWCFIRRSKHLETIKALSRSGLVLSSVSRCLEPLIKPSHSLLIYYVIAWFVVIFGINSVFREERPLSWCSRLLLRELNSILMLTFSFVLFGKHAHWSREWKHSMGLFIWAR